MSVGSSTASSAGVRPADEVTPDQAPSRGLSQQLSLLVTLDVVLGFALILDRFPMPGIGQPAGIVIMGLFIGMGFLRRPTHLLRHRNLIVGLYALMLASAIIVTQLSGYDWMQRSAKMVILLVFALMIAVGRVHLRSLLVGLTAGLLVNIGLFYAGLTSNAYPPYLTGFLGDKNVAGLTYATVLVAGLAIYRTSWARGVHLLILAVPVILTGSRTSMAAAAAGLVWVLLRNRLPLVLRFALVGVLIWLLGLVERQFARIGLFADRDDTDWFRGQIKIATELKVANAPWYGEGLTTAWVLLDGRRFMWFHDSYASMRIEGGWVMVAIMAVLIGLLGMGLLEQRRVAEPLLYAEGAIVVILVCAWQLGEVFFTTPAFLVLGMAWRLRLGVPIVQGVEGLAVPTAERSLPADLTAAPAVATATAVETTTRTLS